MNESLDPSVVIARLKQEVRDLKEEIALLKGNTPQRGPLTPDELLRLRQQLLAYVEDPQAGAAGSDGSSTTSSTGLNLGGDMMMIRASECPARWQQRPTCSLTVTAFCQANRTCSICWCNLAPTPTSVTVHSVVQGLGDVQW